MRCERFLDEYDALEPGRPMPWVMKRHLGRCPSCRAEVYRLEGALAAWKASEGIGGSGPADFEDGVMAAVRLTRRPRREMTMGQWMAPAFLLAASCIALPLSLGGGATSGEGFLLPLAIVAGLGFAVFGGLFVSSHMEELKPWLEERLAGGFMHRH